MFRSHGLSGSVSDGLWTCRGRAPPFHSNAVTLEPEGAAAQAEAIGALRASIGRPFSVKDSFARLDLAPLGFRPLFDAEWVLREPADPPAPASPSGAEWRRAGTTAGLEAWEAAWRENGSPAGSRVFPPSLLGDPELALLAAFREDRIVAGCAAHRSAEAVGWSNYFASGDGAGALRTEAVGEAARFGPGLPVVGYERGEDLAPLLDLGFRPVGPLRVWEGVGRKEGTSATKQLTRCGWFPS
jgi:hypothetical protein